jgi:mRNA-degrading endonuclease toxin of MazEF toxin-antitoxin module
MVDKIQSARRDRIKDVIGSASQSELAAVDAALRGWLGVET